MYSILKNANKEQLVLFTTSGLCFLAGPGRKAGSVGNSSSCLGSHGDSGVAGLLPGPGEKAKGGVRKIVRTLVSPSGVLLSVLNGCCCPQLALSSRLYRSGWGSQEWGLVAGKVSQSRCYLWFPGSLLALLTWVMVVISSQFLFWGGLAFVPPPVLRIRRGGGRVHTGFC